jgi:hypothetical protein
MYILVAIAIFCFFALLLAAIAIVRHVRSRRRSAGPQADFAHHLFAAVVNDQASLTPCTLPQQNIKEVIAETSWNRALEPTLADIRNQSISSKRF